MEFKEDIEVFDEDDIVSNDDKENRTISYLGHTFSSMYIDNSMEKEMGLINHIREAYFEDSGDLAKSKMLKELNDLLNHNGNSTASIYRWFFERIACDCKFDSVYSINEYFASDDIMQMSINRIRRKPKLFIHDDMVKNFKTMFQIAGGNLCRKLPNYPFKECKNLIKKHVKGASKKGKLYVDPCCGWGIRMLAAASLGMDYVGFDVNPQLIEKLNEMGQYIKAFKPDFKYKIIPHGSEIFVDELVDKADVIFTSPPYYQLEDYGTPVDGSVEIMNISYEEWLKAFAYPMLENMIKYAKVGSDVMINIKDIPKYPMLQDFGRIMKEVGGDSIEMQKYEKLVNNVRTVCASEEDGKITSTRLDNSEKIIVGRKVK